MGNFNGVRQQAFLPQKKKKRVVSRHLVLYVLLLSVLAIAITCGWQWLKDPKVLPIKTVKVSANFKHVDPDWVKATLLPYLKRGNFFTVSTHDIKRNLSTHPWIDTVAVQRVWPDKLSVTIVEQEFVARWNREGLMNARAEVVQFPENELLPVRLPLFKGSEGQQANVLHYYQEMGEIVSRLGLRIGEIEINPRRSCQIVLSNRTRLLLGRTDIVPRLTRWVLVWPKLQQLNPSNAPVIDLRYPNGLAVREK